MENGLRNLSSNLQDRFDNVNSNWNSALQIIKRDLTSLLYKNKIKTSITDTSSYKQALESIIDNADFFDTFRKVPIIKDTYEHEFPENQKKYFFDMFYSNSKILNNLDELSNNDMVGLGRTQKLSLNTNSEKSIQHYINSIATLRYIAIAHLIEQYFGKLEAFRIVEIGVAYGGQGRIPRCFAQDTIVLSIFQWFCS